jgi:hypothetical protein
MMQKPIQVSAVVAVILSLMTSGARLDRSHRWQPALAAPQEIVIDLAGKQLEISTVAAADFNGDGYKEIVAGGSDGMLYVVSTSDGGSWGPVWSRQANDDINAAGPPNPNTENYVQASPAIADLDNDGHLDIVVAMGPDVHNPDLSKHRNGGILVYRYNSEWDFAVTTPSTYDAVSGKCNDGGWPQPCIDQVGWPPSGYSGQDGYWDPIVTTPALGDLDGDGDLEIVFEGIDRRIHAWHHDGTVVESWPVSQFDGDDLWRGGMSSPALGDIDDDGLPEVVVGTMSPMVNGQQGKNATLWAINGDSTVVPGFPIQTEQVLHSSPALGDIDGDGHLEIVIGTGWGTPGRENIVYAFNHDGTPLPNWPQETVGVTYAPPALGDIDNDGELEIVIGTGNLFDATSGGSLHAWNADGSPVPGFPIKVTQRIGPLSNMPHSPVLADFDGDGTVEILVVPHGEWGVIIVEPDGSAQDNVSHSSYVVLLGSPIVDDVDNDGLLEIVTGGGHFLNDMHAAIGIWNESGAVTSALPWPMFRHNVARTGLYSLPPKPPKLAFPSQVSVLHQFGSGNTATRYVRLANEGDGEFDWAITESIPELQVTPSAGTVVTSTSVRFDIDTTVLGSGWHNLGTVAISGTVEGVAVDGSPVASTFYVYIGDVARIYIPLVARNY